MAESPSKWVENAVGKGEIACNEQFLLFPQCFQKTCTADTLKPGLVWERIKDCEEEGFGKHYGKRTENAGNQHFLSFSHSVFYCLKERNCHCSNV